MAGEWTEATVGEAFDVSPSRTLKRGDVAPFIPMDALPVHARAFERIDYREFTGSGTRFKNGDTLIARITPCLENGKTAYVAGLPDNSVGHGSTEYIVLAGRESLSDGLFGYYLARSPDFRRYAIGHMEGTSGRQRVPGTAIEKYVLALPPLPEQRAIAHILGTLDDKIELNRRRNQTLEAMARAVFKDWFVDFGPVRAKMEAREPYLPADLWQLFPDRLDDESKPEGWEIGKLGNFVAIFDSRRVPLSGKQRAERRGPYPYHGAAGIMDSVDDFLFDGVHVLLGEDGSVVHTDGRPYTQYVWGKFWVNNHAHVLRGNGISNETLLVFLDQCDIAPFVTGAVQPKLSQGNLKAIPFLAPGPALLKRFGELIDPLFAQVRDTTEESRILAQLRDTLLPKLISGKLRIQDAERRLATASVVT